MITLTILLKDMYKYSTKHRTCQFYKLGWRIQIKWMSFLFVWFSFVFKGELTVELWGGCFWCFGPIGERFHQYNINYPTKHGRLFLKCLFLNVLMKYVLGQREWWAAFFIYIFIYIFIDSTVSWTQEMTWISKVSSVEGSAFLFAFFLYIFEADFWVPRIRF